MKLKKILAAAVSAVMAVGCMTYMPQTDVFEPMTVEAGSYGDLRYSVSSSNYTVTITSCSSTATSVVIPSKIDGYIVNCIGSKAFAGCDLLTSITIPNSVTSINKGAFFGCASLSSVTIPDSVKEICSDAFYNTAIVNNQTTDVKYIDKWVVALDTFVECIEIKKGTIGIANSLSMYKYVGGNLKIPDGVLYIGNGAFYKAHVTSITIPGSVTSIEDGAFCGCDSLSSVTISDGVKSIKEDAFLSCYNITSITIPNSVTFIGSSAFESCLSLESITIENPKCLLDKGAFTPLVDTTIYGYENSSAQAYADKYGMAFESLGEAPVITTPAETPQGDANSDGKVTVRDCAFIASALANKTADTLPKSADFNKDGKINVRDAAAIAAALAKDEI